MIRATARYRNQILELDQPLALAEGTQVEVDIRPAEEAQRGETQAWAELGMSRLEEEWDNPEDAVYDDWKKLYGIGIR
jgi:predicted DNA-binding antitoxin AbrB/MazE fold protein